MAKRRYAHLTLSVPLPKGMTVAQARHAVSQSWYGEVFSDGSVDPYRFPRGEAPVLHPRWGRAYATPRKD